MNATLTNQWKRRLTLNHGKTAHMVASSWAKSARRWEGEECPKNLARSMAVGKWFSLDQKLRGIIYWTKAWPERREVNSAISLSGMLPYTSQGQQGAGQPSLRVASSVLCSNAFLKTWWCRIGHSTGHKKTKKDLEGKLRLNSTLLLLQLPLLLGFWTSVSCSGLGWGQYYRQTQKEEMREGLSSRWPSACTESLRFLFSYLIILRERLHFANFEQGPHPRKHQ